MKNAEFGHKLERYSLLEKAYSDGYLSDHDFSELLTNYLISPGGYVLDTGSGDQVNAEVALRLFANIKRHPYLWKKFFMVG